VNPRRPHGTITRGTTNPNRLRLLDRWWTPRAAAVLRHVRNPLAVDLGYGATPVTTIEWRRRLALIHNDVTVVGLEIDPARVALARASAAPGLEFHIGGFELAGFHPHLVRVMNVLRQYDEAAVPDAWRLMRDTLAPGGSVAEGTCDELGRHASWVLLDRVGPVSLTLAADLDHLDTPDTLAERLPKALIHRNVPGEPVHALIAELSGAWRRFATSGVYGARDRWRRSVDTVAAAGWPVAEPPARRRDGTLTVAWPSVAPR